MIQKKTLSSFVLFIFLVLPFSGQKAQHFYDVDKEIQIEGKIKKIVMEPRYKTTAPFLVLVVQDKKSQLEYNVEVSPTWFFSRNFHVGEDLRVMGSTYSDGTTKNLIARQIMTRGKWHVFRDKNGFPSWRGRKMQHKKKRDVIRY